MPPSSRRTRRGIRTRTSVAPKSILSREERPGRVLPAALLAYYSTAPRDRRRSTRPERDRQIVILYRRLDEVPRPLTEDDDTATDHLARRREVRGMHHLRCRCGDRMDLSRSRQR